MVGLTVVVPGFSAMLISRTGRYKIFPLIGIVLMSVATVLFCRIGVGHVVGRVRGPTWRSSAWVWACRSSRSFWRLRNAVPAGGLSVVATSLAILFQQMGGNHRHVDGDRRDVRRGRGQDRERIGACR